MLVKRAISQRWLPMLCVGLAATSLCIGTTQRSLAQEPVDRAYSAPASVAELPKLLAEHYPTIRSLVLSRRDCVEFEYYRGDLSAESRSPVRSVTKSVLSILVGIARDQGYLRLDGKLSEILPEVLDPTIDPRVRDITIRDLLTMTSGFGTPPFGARPGIPVAETWEWSLNRPIQFAPGTHFNYDDDSVNLLSVALTRAIRQDAKTYAKKNLFDPLDITNFEWMADSDGYLIGADTLSLTARDMAKIGLLYLQHGLWSNNQIVSSDYVADSTAKHNGGGFPARTAYGYLWWVTQTTSGLNAFFAAGKGSELIYVVPKLGLVVAVVSSSYFPARRFINDILLPAASGEVVPTACVAQLARGNALH